MADEELLADKGYLTCVRAGKIKAEDIEIVKLSVGSKAAQIGDVLTHVGESYKNVDLCGAGEEVAGFLLDLHQRVDQADFTIDDTITDGLYVKMFKKRAGGSGVTLALKLENVAVAHVDGQKVYSRALGEVGLAYVASTFDASADGDPTDTEIKAESDKIMAQTKGEVGRFRDAFTGDGTDAKVTLVEV